VDFELVGHISDIEAIAIGRAARDRRRLDRLYGKGRWRKMKGVGRIRLPDGWAYWLSCIGMKRTASVGKRSRRNATSGRSRRPNGFVVCVRSAGYEASLERNKIYITLPDQQAEQHGQLRVVDDSGEDYLFSADRFVAIEVPAAVRLSLLKAS
jgi:hypothetical protein